MQMKQRMLFKRQWTLKLQYDNYQQYLSGLWERKVVVYGMEKCTATWSSHKYFCWFHSKTVQGRCMEKSQGTQCCLSWLTSLCEWWNTTIWWDCTSATRLASTSDDDHLTSSIWDKLNRATVSATTTTSSTTWQACEWELVLYTVCLVLSRNASPYSWWMVSNQLSFILNAGCSSVPAAVLPSHVSCKWEIFSKAGDVITKKRNTMAPAKADCVVFLMESLQTMTLLKHFYI